jgi:hypothetical protein
MERKLRQKAFGWDSVEKARAALKDLKKPDRPSGRPRVRDAVTATIREIQAALKRGCTPAQVIDAFKASGIEMSPKTLRQYMKTAESPK